MPPRVVDAVWAAAIVDLPARTVYAPIARVALRRLTRLADSAPDGPSR